MTQTMGASSETAARSSASGSYESKGRHACECERSRGGPGQPCRRGRLWLERGVDKTEV